MQKRWLEHAEEMVAGGIGSKQGDSYAQRQAGAKAQHKQGRLLEEAGSDKN